MKQPVEISTASDGLIVFTFSGNLLDEDLVAFKLALDMAAMTIVHRFNDQHKKVKTLLDMRNFSGKYCAGAIDILTEFAKKDAPYVEKTASFGGSNMVKIAGEVVLNLAGRDNIKIFDSQEKALEWLNA